MRRTPDDTLVYVLEARVRQLDPRWVLASNDTKLSRLLTGALVTIDQPSMEPIMELAESVVAEDPTTWTVTLRQGLRFSDGSPLTSRDVVHTFRTILDPARQSAHFRMYDERVATVEAVDERRTRFHLKQPLATFVTDMEIGIVCAACDARGDLVGAGPFRLVSQSDDEVVMERNPHYFRGPPPLRRLVFRVMTDANARILVLAGGAADLTQNTVRLDLVPDVEKLERVRVDSAPSALLTYLMMKNDDPILRDVRVRRAIACAIDRPAIVRAKMAGRAVLATGLLAPGHWAYSGDVPTYPYDPARARALLDEAGYPDPDGDGPGVRFTLTYKTSADAFRVAIARLIAQMLREVGIGVDVRSYEFATFFADVKKGQYQLASLQTGEIAEPDMYNNFFHSSRIPTPAEPDLANRWRYRSDVADRLIEEGRHELDRDARKRIYAELQRVVATDLPIVPLWHEDNVAVMNVSVEGFTIVPTARLSSLARTRKKLKD